MNDINSVLVEGVVQAAPYCAMTCRFVVSSSRVPAMSEGFTDDTPQVTKVTVIARGRLAVNLCETLHAGQRVRVVGRLAEERWSDIEPSEDDELGAQTTRGGLIVVAEHVEFKVKLKGR
jgi:single-stranded DNA-binding protein